MTRRIVVGFVEVETAQDRMWRHAASGLSTDAMLAEPRKVPKPFHDGGHTYEGRFRYWCLADGSEIIQGPDFQLAAIYRTSKVPADAKCEECGIGLRELQKMFAPTPAMPPRDAS